MLARTSTNCVCCGEQLPPAAALKGHDRMYGVAGESEVFICARCGTGRTFPLLDEQDLGELYPESYAPHVLDQGASPGRMRALIHGFVERLQRKSALASPPIRSRPDTPSTMLDVGCGRGDLGRLMIELGWVVTGVEPSEGAGEAARAQGLEILGGTLGTVDLSDRKFEIVSFQHSFEHVYDPNVDLERVLPHLADDGLLMISAPNFGSWQRELFGSAWYHLDTPRHRFHYTAEGLRTLFERHDLEVLDIATTTTPFGIVGSVTNAVAGEWIWNSPMRSNLAYVIALVLKPLDWLLARLAGGDALHVVARHRARH